MGQGKNKMQRVAYFDVGQWPIHVGFTTDEKAFKREIKRLKCGDVKFLLNDHSSATTHFLTGDKGGYCAIICLGECDGFELSQIAGLIAHEATHVAQQLWRRIGEQDVGDETEAYFIQLITQCCLNELSAFKSGCK
jgi:hypothetical protein